MRGVQFGCCGQVDEGYPTWQLRRVFQRQADQEQNVAPHNTILAPSRSPVSLTASHLVKQHRIFIGRITERRAVPRYGV